MLTVTSKGSFRKTEQHLRKLNTLSVVDILHKYGKQGVAQLSANTPIDSGETSHSWDYQVRKTRSGFSLIWTNSHIDDGVPIAVILQYGHGTGTGGYVAGIDYINPALKPVFESIKTQIWREVKSL